MVEKSTHVVGKRDKAWLSFFGSSSNGASIARDTGRVLLLLLLFSKDEKRDAYGHDGKHSIISVCFLSLPFVSALRKSTARQGDVFVIRPLLGLSACPPPSAFGREEGDQRPGGGVHLRYLLDFAVFFLPIYFYILLPKLNDPRLLLVIFFSSWFFFLS